jgi:2-polyprenyl-6-methoxyphenol hydroxylase-like FAD-dependent oxidoreductase
VTAPYLLDFDVNFNLTVSRNIPFKLTNWKTLNYRLRANFDGLRSEYVPVPPERKEGDGKVVYEVGKRVQDVSHNEDSSFSVIIEDVDTGVSSILHPDLVITADGANSTIRKLFFPGIGNPYSGYLTWRGVIPEKDVSEETMKFLEGNAVRYFADGSYIVM